MILCSFPGKAGDILWSLPTVRAISRLFGEKVDMVIGKPYQDLVPLLRLQPYIRYAWADPEWEVRNTAPMTPWEPPMRQAMRVFGEPPVEYEKVFHLGYREWPKTALPIETMCIAEQQVGKSLFPLIDIDEPWITAPADVECWPGFESDVVVGFTDEWIELKAGVVFSLIPQFQLTLLTREGSRWDEWNDALQEQDDAFMLDVSYEDAAACIAQGKVFLGCLSSKAVLARGIGKPTVLMEPNPHRHHSIFHEGIHKGLVLGNDGLPTFDARAVRKALEEALGKAG